MRVLTVGLAVKNYMPGTEFDTNQLEKGCEIFNPMFKSESSIEFLTNVLVVCVTSYSAELTAMFSEWGVIILNLTTRENRAAFYGYQTNNMPQSYQDDPDMYQHMALSELRQVLEQRGQSTQTPGLKGDARRHALDQLQRDTTVRRSDDGDTGHVEDDAKSAVVDPSKTTPPFFFSGVTDNQEAGAQTECLDNQQRLSELRDELFEARRQLHQLRAQQHRAIEERLRSAGFSESLESLSRQIEAVERERSRLVKSHRFGHELVTVSRQTLLAWGSTRSDTLELVQSDAVQLLDKRQAALRRQVEQTKEAIEITKRGLKDDECRDAASCDNEARLRERVQQISEALLQQAQDSARSFGSKAQLSWRSVASSVSSCPTDANQELPVLTRCRSMPSAMFKQTWIDLEPEQKQQLCLELRTAASLRIQRDRVSLGGLFGSLTSRTSSPPTPAVLGGAVGVLTPSNAPTPADRLGVKALFLELTKRGVLETSRAYQRAIALDEAHATNLGNYARFLYLQCGNVELAHDHFERAVRADPFHAQNLVKYANFLQRARHDMEQAEQRYQQALRLASNDLDAMGNYASLLAKKRDPADKQRAKALLELALRIAPRHVTIRLQYSAVLAAVGEFDAAERCYEQLVESVELRERRKDDGSVGEDTVDKEHAHVFGNYANFLRRRRRMAEAKQMYAKALALHPSHPLLLRNLCLCQFSRITEVIFLNLTTRENRVAFYGYQTNDKVFERLEQAIETTTREMTERESQE
ncbi:hypothetical protein PybrP1_009024 [[Pythium] brassicae (nom. inval.)]|nr:hypothetical protein PybrP1_009024 [[Pythium] brassicae (nom. inval.)]